MFFVLSKLFAFATLPSTVLVIVGLAGVALSLTRWRRAGRALMAAALLLLALAGLSPAPSLLAATLESRFPDWTPSAAPPAGIIVLGGAIDADSSRKAGAAVLGRAFERLTAVPALARRYPAVPVIYSGGNGELFGGEGREADYALPLLERLGVPRERLIAERQSRNTAENAAFTRALLDPKPGQRWLLVTSAAHMPRAVGCFRHAGFEVEAVPVDRTATATLWPRRWLAEGLVVFDTAAREWIGLVVYRLTGRIDTLFPGPR